MSKIETIKTEEVTTVTITEYKTTDGENFKNLDDANHHQAVLDGTRRECEGCQGKKGYKEGYRDIDPNYPTNLPDYSGWVEKDMTRWVKCETCKGLKDSKRCKDCPEGSYSNYERVDSPTVTTAQGDKQMEEVQTICLVVIAGTLIIHTILCEC